MNWKMTQDKSKKLVKHTRPTLYFMGVTTGESSINRLFFVWAQILDCGKYWQVQLQPP
jgi:hypothetical protein